MTPVSSTSLRPLVPAKLADAPVNAPVCSHTMTGAGSVGAASRIQTFSLRQSSLPVMDPPGTKKEIDGQLAGVVALNTDGAQGASACGGFQRLPPAVEAAYGIPMNAHDAPRSCPWTSP